MRERVQEILMEIGIPANLKGFKYILDIMELFEEDEAWRNAKMMIVYEKVARMNNKLLQGRKVYSLCFFQRGYLWRLGAGREISVSSQCDKWKFTSHTLC